MTPAYVKVAGSVGGGVVTDLDLITKSGIYYSTGGVNTHTPNNSESWMIIHNQYDSGSTYAVQLANSVGGNDFQFRRIKNTTWGSWVSVKLGNSATRDVGTTAGTVAAGNDARFPA